MAYPSIEEQTPIIIGSKTERGSKNINFSKGSTRYERAGKKQRFTLTHPGEHYNSKNAL